MEYLVGSSFILLKKFGHVKEYLDNESIISDIISVQSCYKQILKLCNEIERTNFIIEDAYRRVSERRDISPATCGKLHLRFNKLCNYCLLYTSPSPRD